MIPPTEKSIPDSSGVETKSDISQDFLCSSAERSWVAACACKRGHVVGVAGIRAGDLFRNEGPSTKNICQSILQYSVPINLAAHAVKHIECHARAEDGTVPL